MIDVVLPFNGWKPRPHQMKLWSHLRRGGKRAIAVWHRRAGKDEVMLHHAACAMALRPANYWHLLPEYEQGRKAIWNAINPHTGRRRIDEVFPLPLRSNTNDNEMFIRLKNGATWQVVGSDRYNATVGASVAGITYSEWALSNPASWAYHKPILEENNGWAVFITTPRGRNHAMSMFNMAQQDPHWFCERLTARDTGSLTEEQLAEALKEYVALYGRDVGSMQFNQEYLVDWNAAVLGAYFSLEMQDVRNEGRILPIEAIAGQPVHRAWDIGMKDDTSVIWFQVVGAQIFILDCVSASQVGLPFFVDEIEKREWDYGWKNGTDYVPHDIKVKEWIIAKTRVAAMREAGLSPMLVPMAKFLDGISAARRTLPICVFHPRTEETLVSALEQYRREWDEEKRTFKPTDVHDWTAHPTAAFRYLALGYPEAPRYIPPEPKREGFIIPPPPDPFMRGGLRI